MKKTMKYISYPGDIRRLFRGCGFMFVDPEGDTTNLLCQKGHIYLDGTALVASMDAATAAESRSLRKLGRVVADGDFGELSVAFPIEKFRDVARIMKPKQAILHQKAA